MSVAQIVSPKSPDGAWRSNAPFDMKAAALALGAVLATPYAFTYDLVILAIPVAFLLRTALASGFRALAAGLLVSFPFVLAPVGLLATLIIAALVARRCIEHDPEKCGAVFGKDHAPQTTSSETPDIATQQESMTISSH